MQRLPEDIPHRQALINAGFINYAVLQCHRSFETIRGLDSKAAAEVKDYIFGDAEADRSSDYSIAELREMDLSDKDESFFEGDERKSVDQFK